MAVFAWLQPTERIWKVITDQENGTLKVYNEKNDLMMERKGLSKEIVSLIENEFLGVVATRLTDNDNKPVEAVRNKNVKKVVDHNPMYA